MEGQRKLAIGPRRGRVRRVLMKTPGHAAESPGQRHRLVVVPQAAQKPPHSGHLPPRAVNRAPGGGQSGFPGLKRLEEQTVEFPAVAGALGINAAPAAVEKDAGLTITLRRTRRAAGRGANLGGQPGQEQDRVARLQSHIAENRAVAA